MANNRIYLRCRNCGSGFFLGKMFGADYCTSNVYYKNKDFLESLNNFYEEHLFCEKPLHKEDINFLEPKFKKPQKEVDAENQFEIAYEFWNEDNEN